MDFTSVRLGCLNESVCSEKAHEKRLGRKMVDVPLGWCFFRDGSSDPGSLVMLIPTSERIPMFSNKYVSRSLCFPVRVKVRVRVRGRVRVRIRVRVRHWDT